MQIPKDKIKKFVKNPWVIGIGATISGSLIIQLVGWITGTELLKLPLIWFIDILKDIHNFLNDDYILSLYMLIFIFIFGFVTCGIIFLLLIRIKILKHETLPEWLKYKEDKFKRVLYKWEFEKDYDGNYIVTNIRPYCPKCKCLIVANYCPKCDEDFFHKLISITEVMALIYHKIDTEMQ